jgi:chromosome segregation ATPase
LTELLSTHIANLEADRSIIRSTHSQLVERLPSLRSKAQELRAELEQEKKRQQEFESADQEHLAELRRDIEEQNAQVEDYKRENLDAESRLERLNVKHVELDEQMKEAKDSIEKSKKVVDEVRYYTKSEAYRLQGALSFSSCLLQRARLTGFVTRRA